MIKALMTTKPINSLRTRIILSALLVVLLVLPSIGIALHNAFEAQVKEGLKEQLNAYFYSVLAVTEFENNEIMMPEVLLENQFNLISSGLYALITQRASQNENETNTLWFSNSFLGLDSPANLPSPALGQSSFQQIQLNQQTHYVFSYSVQFEVASQSSEQAAQLPAAQLPIITLHILKDSSSIAGQQKAFSQQLWTWLIVLMVALVIIQMFWLTWTLKPLERFTHELNKVQLGQAEQLKQDYPNELNTVAKQLNALLKTEQRQRKRYRNALADLAHSLKTPLAVIQSQQDLSASSTEQISQINRTIAYQLKRAQSAGNKAWHLGIKVTAVANKLLRTLPKIYPNIHLSYTHEPANDCIFQGDESDLTEILGNLLDNACKAATHKVLLSIYKQQKCLIISVQDDGKGIPNAQKSLILERGKRADTYATGNGIGLAIVQDLVLSYEGKLEISTGEVLGGAQFTISLPLS